MQTNIIVSKSCININFQNVTSYDYKPTNHPCESTILNNINFSIINERILLTYSERDRNKRGSVSDEPSLDVNRNHTLDREGGPLSTNHPPEFLDTNQWPLLICTQMSSRNGTRMRHQLVDVNQAATRTSHNVRLRHLLLNY